MKTPSGSPSAPRHFPAQTHRYQWDKAGRLEKASVYQHPRDLVTNLATQPDINPDTATYLQSQIELQRDTLGRLSTETQRLYRPGPNGQPEVEFEHSISHQFDALGNRQASVLQGAGQIDWQLYGSGHVHGLLHNGASLVDIERDGLHRETQRSLHGPNPNPNPSSALQIQRQWDSLGRLQSIHTQGLGAGATPQPLIGQLSQRRYHYDALGQLAGIQMSDQTMRYGYDAAGRLRGAASSLTPQAPQTITRWNIDPAGNRLPAPSQDSQGPGIDWAAQQLGEHLGYSIILLERWVSGQCLAHKLQPARTGYTILHQANLPGHAGCVPTENVPHVLTIQVHKLKGTTIISGILLEGVDLQSGLGVGSCTV